MKDLDDYIRVMPVTHLHFHLLTNLTSLNLDEYLKRLGIAYPDKKIILSGPKTKEVTVNIPTVRLLKSMNELIEYAEEE